MKRKKSQLKYFFLILLTFSIVFSSADKVFALNPHNNLTSNTITGTVFDNRRNPLPEVPVELLNDLSQVFARTRTDSVGRYSFIGMPTGRYQIRVIPSRYDFEEQVIDIELLSLSFKGSNGNVESGSDSIMQDFYLRPRRGSLGLSNNTGVIFIQDVPKPAEKLYEKAIEEFGNNKKPAAIASLEESLKIFPNYFLALNRLGFEKFDQEDFTAASEVLARAADVNPQNISTLYLLAYSLHLSKKNQPALKVVQYISSVNSSIPRVALLTGMILKMDGQYEEAEKQFLQAKKLSKDPLPDVHWQLALLYGNNLKRYTVAAEELETFLKLQPKSRDSENIKKLIQQFRNKSSQK